MLATLTEKRFSDPAWIFERKLDGVRCLAYRDGRELRLLSQLVVVVGAVGALLVGYHENGALVYAGKVGTGFTTEMLTGLQERLEPLVHERPPFGRGSPREAGVHWVKPVTVAQIGFTGWTRDGKLRHPRFQGYRHRLTDLHQRLERGLDPWATLGRHARGLAAGRRRVDRLRADGR